MASWSAMIAFFLTRKEQQLERAITLSAPLVEERGVRCNMDYSSKSSVCAFLRGTTKNDDDPTPGNANSDVFQSPMEPSRSVEHAHTVFSEVLERNHPSKSRRGIKGNMLIPLQSIPTC